MISKTSSRGAPILTVIGPSSWMLRPHPRSRWSRPMASSRNIPAIRAIKSPPSAPTVIQSPVIAATAAPLALGPTRASADGGEDRVAERALADRAPGCPDELDRLVGRDRRSRRPTESEDADAPEPVQDPIGQRRRVLVARFDPGRAQPSA